MAIDIGRIAYAAYTNEVFYLGQPKWEELDKDFQDAWRKVGVAVIQHIDKTRKQMEDDPEVIG